MTQTCGVVSLFVGTFNMGGTQLPKNGIAEWISPGHDLYCIGVQEIGLSAIKGDNPEDDEEDITALVWEQIKNSIEEYFCRMVGSFSTVLFVFFLFFKDRFHGVNDPGARRMDDCLSPCHQAYAIELLFA